MVIDKVLYNFENLLKCTQKTYRAKILQGLVLSRTLALSSAEKPAKRYKHDILDKAQKEGMSGLGNVGAMPTKVL